MTVMDRIDQMRLFTRIFETRSFSRAARDLGMTQPTVSKSLQALETTLGVKLLERNTHGLRSNEAGALYYERCKRWLSEMDQSVEELISVHKGARGTLRLSAPTNIGQVQLARIAFSFQRQYPGVHIDLKLEDRVIDLVKDGADIAIRIGQVRSTGVVARRLARYRPVLVAAPSYLQRRAAPTNLTELRAHRVLYSGVRTESISLRGRSRVLEPDAKLVVANAQVMREAVREGLALGLLSPWLVHTDLERGTLIRVLPEAEGEEFSVYAVYLPSRTQPARIREFLQHCVREVPRIPGLVRP
jgi:DNA-binding transcriptional LysR family regulator